MLLIDRFHLMHLVIEALGVLLRSIKASLSKPEQSAFGLLRRCWLKSYRDGQLDLALALERLRWLGRFPQLERAIDWIQDLRHWFDRRYAGPARRALEHLIERARGLGLESFAAVAATLERWFEPIVAFITHRYTNAVVEGFNTKIKLIQRSA